MLGGSIKQNGKGGLSIAGKVLGVLFLKLVLCAELLKHCSIAIMLWISTTSTEKLRVEMSTLCFSVVIGRILIK